MTLSQAKGWGITALILFAVLASWSRIAMMKESPQLIKNGADALAKLFNGAFGL
jgi:hypothetical protein